MIAIMAEMPRPPVMAAERFATTQLVIDARWPWRKWCSISSIVGMVELDLVIAYEACLRKCCCRSHMVQSPLNLAIGSLSGNRVRELFRQLRSVLFAFITNVVVNT